MSRWSYYSRHASPYSSSPNRSPPVITDADYMYVNPDDVAGDWSSSRQSGNYTSPNDASVPDLLFVKHRNRILELELPAFSIAEGYLKIKLIRQYVADKLGIKDPRRVKLLYKNTTLRDDEQPARDAGLKQNSELLCIVTEAPYDDSGSSGGEGSSRGPHVDVDGTIIPGRRAHRQSTSRRDRETVYPSNSNPSTPSRNNFPQPTATSTSRPSPTPNTSANDLRTSGQATPTSMPTPYTPPPGPRSPRETVQDLLAVFDTKYKPLCQAFIDNPPSDSKARTQEHAKLSETVLAQIILKLDNVQTEGNEVTRRMRKNAVTEVQAVLTQLDKIVGKVRG